MKQFHFSNCFTFNFFYFCFLLSFSCYDAQDFFLHSTNKTLRKAVGPFFSRSILKYTLVFIVDSVKHSNE